MGELAFAGATSHVGAIIRDPNAEPERSARLDLAWRRLDARITAARLDAVVVVATDHYETFGLDNYPAFALGIADVHEGWGEFGTPGGPVAGRPEVAVALLAGLVGRDFDVSAAHGMRLDHSFTVPVTRLPAVAAAGVVPLFVNCNTPPMPSLPRCLALGRALRESVQALPAGTRVGVLATGGISHWVGLPRFGEVNSAFDRAFLDLLDAGDLAQVLAWSDAFVLEEAGNGALEIRTWLTALGAADQARTVSAVYEPMLPWGIGIGVAEFGARR